MTEDERGRLIELLKALKASAAAHEKLLRAWMYTPFPKDVQVLGGMSPPVGPIADAVTDVRCARAAIAKAEAALKETMSSSANGAAGVASQDAANETTRKSEGGDA